MFLKLVKQIVFDWVQLTKLYLPATFEKLYKIFTKLKIIFLKIFINQIL